MKTKGTYKDLLDSQIKVIKKYNWEKTAELILKYLQ